MKAWLIDGSNGLAGLRLAEVPEPAPQPGEVVLEMHYAGLNPADRYLSEGQYPAKPAFPHTLGRDGIGTVARVGDRVDGVQVGDRRAVLRGVVGVERPGTFAERVVVPAHDLAEVPADWTEPEGGGGTLVYLTAYQALTMWGTLPPSAVILVTGASGGVGTATVQLAAAMGCTVVALSRSATKSERLRQLGAAMTFDPGDAGWHAALKRALTPRRVELAIDNIGGNLLPEVIDTLGQCGRVSLVGRLAGPVPSFNTASLFFRRLRLGGVAVGGYTRAESREAWQRVRELLARTGARPVVDKIFPLDQLPAAFARLAEGPMGKVLLRVRAD